MNKTIPSTVVAAIGAPASAGTEPKTLREAIQRVLAAEASHEDHAEKYIEVYAEGGFVRLPGINEFLPTDLDSISFRGTDDHVFKDYIEKSLWPIFEALTEGSGAAWSRIRQPRSATDPRIAACKLTTLGTAILDCCREYDPRWAVAYTHHVFHPIPTVMFRAMRRHATALAQRVPHGTSIVIDPGTLHLLDRLLRFVRRVSRTWKFINALRECEQQAESNFASARDFIIGLAKDHSKLLILRIDLYWRPGHDIARGRDHIKKFLRWLRSEKCEKTLPAYLGFIIKEESGLIRGMHWHVFVVADGNLQCRAGYLTRQLGDEWARRTGQGRGCYHNCYSKRARYQANGLGVMGLYDWEKMLGLRRALFYITKRDCILMVNNDKTKHFWRSPDKPGQATRRGRPRASQDSLRLLKRMLGGKRSKVPPGMEG